MALAGWVGTVSGLVQLTYLSSTPIERISKPFDYVYSYV